MVTKQERAAAEVEQRQQAEQETQARGRLEGLIRERVLHDWDGPRACTARTSGGSGVTTTE
jgi:hypothetical protein